MRAATRIVLQWQAEDEIALPSWGGVLKFSVMSGEGFDPEWLRAEPLEVRPRGGGERFKPHPARPSKTLEASVSGRRHRRVRARAGCRCYGATAS